MTTSWIYRRLWILFILFQYSSYYYALFVPNVLRQKKNSVSLSFSNNDNELDGKRYQRKRRRERYRPSLRKQQQQQQEQLVFSSYLSKSSSLSYSSSRLLAASSSSSSSSSSSKSSSSSTSSSSVSINTELTNEKVTQLFAWVTMAFEGYDEYNNLMLAVAVIFGNLGDMNSPVSNMANEMKNRAMEQLLKNNNNNNNNANGNDMDTIDNHNKEFITTNNNNTTTTTTTTTALNTTTTTTTTATTTTILDRMEDQLRGEPYSTDDREIASLGAMGAAQWTGNFKTRPHALLDVTPFTTVDDWVQTLSRGCKRTLKRAVTSSENNFTVIHKPIRGGQPAPHSSLSHFRCVIAHEVRLLTYHDDDDDDDNDSISNFLQALAEGVSRYIGTTRMTGDIYEYKEKINGTVIAIAHEVWKGKVLRGQWFYANDYASQNYVWFHSVYSAVQRAIEHNDKNNKNYNENYNQNYNKNDKNNSKNENIIRVVDLGPSGSDSFSELKQKYGFISVEDWTTVADYTGPFHYTYGRPQDGTNAPARYEKQLQNQARFPFF